MGQIPDIDGQPDVRGTPSIAGMKDLLHQIGHSTAEVDELNIVHVAGTTGKGSTCAFTESILRAFGKRSGFPRKTGLYSSPPLIYPEETIRINSGPISRDLFTKDFFEVWDILEKAEKPPRYLQLLALTAFHTFIAEGVEAAVIETHNGGEYDATNVVEHPVVTVITPIGLGHVAHLGPSIRHIAWHKSGILKDRAAAISAAQVEEVRTVLEERAAAKHLQMRFVDDDSELPRGSPKLRPEV
ncbi:Uu.00g082620.m01.CDS01 [Anthostomella pinea]|uniref:Uu.00g082620.m01.CDS01 n=1 Tax=Anthostomella pinea TaxID=933095 RepID=A0AAI8VMC0_9PEZI|nr:Uu.00g082620.m01.CDS01 [Anthostomella pinea]